MLSELGRMVAHFLDDVARTGAATDLVLYDHEEREVYATGPRPVPPLVRRTLETRRAAEEVIGSGATERVVVAQPLPTGRKCIRCHGSDEELRGVVTVSLPNDVAAAVRETAINKTLAFSGIALAFLVVIVYTLMRVFVLRPVSSIGNAADEIGKGNLDVKVDRADPMGDEVERLASRINEMIRGLRNKLVLERFVSKSTADAARGAAQHTRPTMTALGVRRPATVLFTDIRGFTAFSETVAPEHVVDMLNRYLQVQARVVERHGGDIDKYVGDELMAVFHGDDATVRAVRAAVEMMEAVEGCRTAADGDLTIGGGISVGDMVHGPIGSESRMDFTVIGDAVNVGARLCSAASPGDILVSAAVRDACANAGDLAFEPLPPLNLKGKREPFPVWRVVRKR
jgi:adenylate cyclase